MSFDQVTKALAHVGYSEVEEFFRSYASKLWLEPITPALRILQIFGAIYRTRVNDRLKKAVLELYEERYAQFYGEAQKDEKVRKLTKSPTTINIIQREGKGVYSFLECHDYPVQIARMVRFQGNQGVADYLKRCHDSTSRAFWFLSNYCSTESLLHTKLDCEAMAQIELDLWRQVGGIRKDPDTGEVILLSFMDMFEWWSEENRSRRTLFENLRSHFKLCDIAQRTFSRIPPPSQVWKEALEQEMKRPFDPNGMERGQSRSQLSLSFSYVDLKSSPQSDQKEKIPIERRDQNGYPIHLSEADHYKKFHIAALLVEMKRLYWILPETAWDELNGFLHDTDNVLRLGTVIYLTAFCMKPIFSPPTASQDPAKKLETWKLTQDTLHRILLPGEEIRFTNFLEAALLFSFCFSHLKILWVNGEAEIKAKACVFEWMRGCSLEQKNLLYEKIIRTSNLNKGIGSLESHEAVFFCKEICCKYFFKPFETLTLWLNLQNPPVWPQSKEGRFATARETKAFIEQVEEYCSGQLLSGEMVQSLFFDQPLLYRHVGSFVDLKTNRAEIDATNTPVLMQKHQQVLIGTGQEGKFEWIRTIFKEGFPLNSPPYRIRLQLAQRVMCATLAERGYQEALFNCPFLNKQEEALSPVFEGWLGFSAPYGTTERGEGFSIGTWIPEEKKGTLQFQATFFQSLEAPRAVTITRPLPFTRKDFNEPTFKNLYTAFLKLLAPEKVTIAETIVWPTERLYKDPVELNALMWKTVRNLPPLMLKELEEHLKVSVNGVAAADQLFYFFVMLKLLTRYPFAKKKSDTLPVNFIPRVLDAVKGSLEPLPNGEGATLMNRVPHNEGDLFNVSFTEYQKPISLFAERIRQGILEKVDCEMLVGSGNFEPYMMNINLSFEKQAATKITLMASCTVMSIPLAYTEKLHLPANFPVEKLEQALVVFLCRIMQHYYMLNKDLVKASIAPKPIVRFDE